MNNNQNIKHTKFVINGGKNEKIFNFNMHVYAFNNFC